MEQVSPNNNKRQVFSLVSFEVTYHETSATLSSLQYYFSGFATNAKSTQKISLAY